MKTITNTFKLHVDPSLYNFRWTDAQYVDVTYNAGITDNGHVVAAADVSGPMYLLGMIACAGKWIEFNKEVEAAAIANATPLLNNQHVDETVMNAIVAYVTEPFK